MTPWDMLMASALGGTVGATVEKAFEGKGVPVLILLSAFLFLIWILLVNVKVPGIKASKKRA